jgi:hypothetical protein
MAKIKILNRILNIESIDQQLSMESNWGIINHSENKIQIRKDLPENIKMETLIHECIHAIDNQLGLGFDEVMTDRLATGIYSLIFDNNWTKIKNDIS